MHPICDDRGRIVARLGDLLEGGQTEVTAVWIDPETGLPCKCRYDYWNREGRFVIDPKSTVSAARESFARSVNSYRYHVQEAHYADGMSVLGEPLEKFWFLAQEHEPPYAVALYKLGPASESRGYELRQRNMQALATALETDRWPSYNRDQAAEIEIPAWGMVD
jgi:exodeoxyribonuclease VIII